MVLLNTDNDYTCIKIFLSYCTKYSNFLCYDWTVLNLENDGFADSLMFSDEATFHLSGQVNHHNVRIWGSENPREFI